MSPKIYYVFGSQASQYYFDHSDMPFDEMAAAMEDMHFTTYKYDAAMNHPTDLLLQYDGWQGFAEIEEELYNLLTPKTK